MAHRGAQRELNNVSCYQKIEIKVNYIPISKIIYKDLDLINNELENCNFYNIARFYSPGFITKFKKFHWEIIFNSSYSGSIKLSSLNSSQWYW